MGAKLIFFIGVKYPLKCFDGIRMADLLWKFGNSHFGYVENALFTWMSYLNRCGVILDTPLIF